MERVWPILLGVVLCFSTAGAQRPGEEQAEVDRLFEEAQRYHLGLDRPVDLQKAFEHYQQVIRLDPEHADAYYNLASLCFEQKRYDLAVAYYRKVVQLQPDDGHTWNNLGTVYERQGKKDLARRLYLKAIQADSTVAVAYYNTARLLSQEGQNERAMAYLEKALRLEPDNPTFVNQHARLEAELGKISNTAIGLIAGAFIGVIALYAFLSRRKGR